VTHLSQDQWQVVIDAVQEKRSLRYGMSQAEINVVYDPIIAELIRARDSKLQIEDALAMLVPPGPLGLFPPMRLIPGIGTPKVVGVDHAAGESKHIEVSWPVEDEMDEWAGRLPNQEVVGSPGDLTVEDIEARFLEQSGKQEEVWPIFAGQPVSRDQAVTMLIEFGSLKATVDVAEAVGLRKEAVLKFMKSNASVIARVRKAYEANQDIDWPRLTYSAKGTFSPKELESLIRPSMVVVSKGPDGEMVKTNEPLGVSLAEHQEAQESEAETVEDDELGRDDAGRESRIHDAVQDWKDVQLILRHWHKATVEKTFQGGLIYAEAQPALAAACGMAEDDVCALLQRYSAAMIAYQNGHSLRTVKASVAHFHKVYPEDLS